MTRRTARIGQRTISYLDTDPAQSSGQAPAGRPVLVLVHAFPLMAEMWRPQIDAVPDGWRIIAPDLAGLGASDDRAPVISLDDYAEDILALLDVLGVHRAVIGGLSMGGYTTFAIHRRAPDRFRGMLLADTRPEADSAQGRLSRQALLARLDADGPAAVADEMVPKLLGPTTRRQRPALEAYVRECILANPAAGIGHALRRMMARPDSTPALANISCPTLVVVGEEDILTPPDVSRQMHGQIAGASLVVLAGAGHLSNLEQPGRFNGALWHFLGGLKSQRLADRTTD